MIRRIFDHTFCGSDSYLHGLRAIEEGRADSCTWAIAQHHTDGDKVFDVVTIAQEEVNGVLCWRVGIGAGSYALRSSGESQDLTSAAVVLADRIGRLCGKHGAWVFRQPMPYEREPFRFERAPAAQ